MFGWQTMVMFVSTIHLNNQTMESPQEKPLFGWNLNHVLMGKIVALSMYDTFKKINLQLFYDKILQYL